MILAEKEKLKKEVEDLKDKIGDFSLRNDYLDSHVLELEDTITRQRHELKNLDEKSKRCGIQRMVANNLCSMQDKEIILACSNAEQNYRHLVEYMKREAYLLEKVQRLKKAWEDSDARRVQEYQAMQDKVPVKARKRPRTETFCIKPTGLNLAACSTEHLPPPEMTPQFETALTFVSKLYRTNEELAEDEAETAASPATPSYSV